MCMCVFVCIFLLFVRGCTGWYKVKYCVVMPLHNGQVGSLPPSGRPPTRQVSPAGYMFPCSPYEPPNHGVVAIVVNH